MFAIKKQVGLTIKVGSACFNSEFGMRNSELMVGRVPRHANLRIYNNACCMKRFVFLGLIDISEKFRDVWEPVPYDCN